MDQPKCFCELPTIQCPACEHWYCTSLEKCPKCGEKAGD